MQIAGAVVLITGANRGIGRAFVEGFSAAGAGKIYGAAREPSTINDRRVQPIKLDNTDPGGHCDSITVIPSGNPESLDFRDSTISLTVA
jgi:NAD(P)-dependent dehydrogenase (short-subunit alcohol dehydrogenase family)